MDVGGGHDRVDINNTFLQPFMSRGMGGGITLSAPAGSYRLEASAEIEGLLIPTAMAIST